LSAQILSLCSGYGGLDIAVEDFYGAQTAYYCEIEPACLEVLAGRFPTALNVGSLEELKTGTIEADIITAGYPCQPFSLAGKREGVFDDRHLWPTIRQVISNVRPTRVILENVSGHLTSGGTAVIGDLARMGYGVKWGTVRASEAGAPHQRKRLFIVANSDGMGAGRDEHRKLFVKEDERETEREERQRVRFTSGHGNKVSWGHYDRAITRWEKVTRRTAPIPVEEGKLSALFVEWMMGLTEGWVTDIVDHRGRALKMLGNGVVPQQAALALEHLG
jgi:DNA (cytosine-5)-methyltransferase 1